MGKRAKSIKNIFNDELWLQIIFKRFFYRILKYVKINMICLNFNVWIFYFLRFFTYKLHMIIFYIFLIAFYDEANPSFRSEAIPMLAATSNT